jgi:transcriptional regulator with XRE-family HTH domain
VSDHLALVVRRAVRAERVRAGLSQAQVAERLGWSRQAYAALEQGTRRLGLAEVPEVCSAIGTTLARLLIDASPDDRRALGLPTD